MKKKIIIILIIYYLKKKKNVKVFQKMSQNFKYSERYFERYKERKNRVKNLNLEEKTNNFIENKNDKKDIRKYDLKLKYDYSKKRNYFS